MADEDSDAGAGDHIAEIMCIFEDALGGNNEGCQIEERRSTRYQQRKARGSGKGERGIAGGKGKALLGVKQSEDAAGKGMEGKRRDFEFGSVTADDPFQNAVGQAPCRSAGEQTQRAEPATRMQESKGDADDQGEWKVAGQAK